MIIDRREFERRVRKIRCRVYTKWFVQGVYAPLHSGLVKRNSVEWRIL